MKIIPEKYTGRYTAVREKYRFLEPVMLLSMLAIVMIVMAFLELADDVMEGDTHAVDTAILMLFRDGNDPQNAWGPPWVGDMVRDISGLGGIIILALVTVGAALYLALRGQKFAGAYLLVTVTIGTLLSNTLKHGYGRPRPDLVPHGSYTFTNSFPSGHSMMAAVVYLSVGILLAKAHQTLALKVYFIGVSIFLTIAIGLSRIYLGVHWPTDVLAGWMAGGVCALILYTIEWAWQEKIFRKKI